MTPEEAIAILSNPDGVKEWNKYRVSGRPVPDLARKQFPSPPQLDRINLSGVSLRGAGLERAQLQHANLKDAQLQGAFLDSAQLEHSTFDGASLANADLRKIQATAASFRNCDLRGANLQSSQLQACDLFQADLRGVIVNSQTLLERANVAECIIDRHSLESLDDYGGLTKGDRMRMRIEDGVATLRASYSGFRQWIHITALLAFVFPYIGFVARRWFHAKFAWPDDAVTITLFEALGRFIWNGGANWQTGWHLALGPFLMFCYGVVYNLLRGGLVWQTKTLELKQEASGLPAVFSLAGFWGMAYRIAEWGFYLNLVIVLIHSVYFLLQRIPVE